MSRFALLILALSLAGCPDSSTPGADAGDDAALDDAATDGGMDAAAPDSDTLMDAGADAPPPGDAGADVPVVDAPPPFDSGLPEPMNHRSERIACDDERPTPPIAGGIGGGCTTHEECTDGRNGRCTTFPRGFSQCTYDVCLQDSGCEMGPCICEGDMLFTGNRCMGGDCQVDADCGAGGWCSPSFGGCGAYSGVVTYYCHTVEDECTDDSDCGDGFPSYCRYFEEMGHWACSDAQCVGK